MVKALRSSFGWIVVDLGYWIDSLYLRIVREADVVLLLTELSVPDLQNLSRIKQLLHRYNIDIDKVKIIVNRYVKKSVLGLNDIEKVFMKPVFYKLPSDYHYITEAINQGEPLSELAPKSKFWRTTQALAAELVGEVKRESGEEAAGKPGFWRRLFSSKR